MVFLLACARRITIPRIIPAATMPVISHTYFGNAPVSVADVSGMSGVASGCAPGASVDTAVSGSVVGSSAGAGSACDSVSPPSGAAVAPGAVQVRLTLPGVGLPAARSLMSAGGRLSACSRGMLLFRVSGVFVNFVICNTYFY